MTTSTASSLLQSLRYTNDNGSPTLVVLDQLKVPSEKTYVDVPDVQTTWSVIRNMQIRGAPLIAMVAVLGLAVDLNSNAKTIQELNKIDNTDFDALFAYIQTKMDYLATARPTAVNVFHALEEVKEVLEKCKDDAENTRDSMCRAAVDHAEFMLQRDVSDNKAIGEFGADAILSNTGGKSACIMTICNTGSLATAGYGTALGVVRALQEKAKLNSVAALETRPYNQGSRLTAFEILEDDMPGGTLICDSMAASYMRIKGVDACVVGADRVCANGDTANKIGTFNLALVAAAHGVPFYVASPFTTLDLSLQTGNQITIEERPPGELLKTSGAPPNMPCWNPSFDVTPARYIAGIITEKGVIRPNVNGELDVAAFVKKYTVGNAAENGSASEDAPAKLEVPFDYTEQTTSSLPAYLAKNAPDAMEALETAASNDLECVEMGDGNLNLVFIVTNTKNQKRIIVKQALPYVRCVGESWPLTLERAYFEFRALTAEKEACSDFVPSLYYFSKPNGLMVMEYIPPPNIILRKGLIQGIRYPTMAADIGTFCAHTLFKTSGFKLSETELRANVEFWEKNREMCALTEQVIFTEPYITAPNNRWTSPQLDTDKAAIEQDVELKIAASKWKHKFVTETQALIHGDLHSGSVMCCPKPHQTKVIDPEFAFYGPMGFDTGAFIANLFLAYVSQGGHDNGEEYAEWILEQIAVFWDTFELKFMALWDDESEHTGMAFKRQLLGDADGIQKAQAEFIKGMLADTLGFAGMKMVRRIVGIAHVEDLDSIEDPDVRAKCERHGLEVGKIFIKTASTIGSIHEAIEIAKQRKP